MNPNDPGTEAPGPPGRRKGEEGIFAAGPGQGRIAAAKDHSKRMERSSPETASTSAKTWWGASPSLDAALTT